MKKAHPFGMMSLILFIVLVFFWPSLLILVGTAICSATGTHFDWKIVIAFAIFYNILWVTICYQGARITLAKREAEKREAEKREAKKKQK